MSHCQTQVWLPATSPHGVLEADLSARSPRPSCCGIYNQHQITNNRCDSERPQQKKAGVSKVCQTCVGPTVCPLASRMVRIACASNPMIAWSRSRRCSGAPQRRCARSAAFRRSPVTRTAAYAHGGSMFRAKTATGVCIHIHMCVCMYVCVYVYVYVYVYV